VIATDVPQGRLKGPHADAIRSFIKIAVLSISRGPAGYQFAVGLCGSARRRVALTCRPGTWVGVTA